MIQIEWWYRLNDILVRRTGYVINSAYAISMEQEGWSLLVQAEMVFFELWAANVTILKGADVADALCSLIDLFSDGELSPEQASIFREHLRTCNTCADKLLENNKLRARLSSIHKPSAEDRLTDAVDVIVDTINSYEQQAIFALLHDGVTYSRMKLYRTLEPMEQGVIVDGNVACTISVRWPSFQDMLYKGKPVMAVVELHFYEPYLHLNKS